MSKKDNQLGYEYHMTTCPWDFSDSARAKEIAERDLDRIIKASQPGPASPLPPPPMAPSAPSQPAPAPPTPPHHHQTVGRATRSNTLTIGACDTLPPILTKEKEAYYNGLEELLVSFYMQHDEAAIQFKMESAKAVYRKGEEIHLKRKANESD